MYSGIGLQTPRGSGTSGHVQSNKFSVKPRPGPSAARSAFPSDAGVKKPDKDMIEHDRKRRIELQVVIFRDALEDQGYTEVEIQEKTEEMRNSLVAESAATDADGSRSNPPLRSSGKRSCPADCDLE